MARGRSRETTFTRDVADPAELDAHLVRLATEVTESVVAEGRAVTHVAVKVRTASFFTRTKISKLPAPTTDPAEVVRGGAARPRTLRADEGRSASSASASCWRCPPDRSPGREPAMARRQ